MKVLQGHTYRIGDAEVSVSSRTVRRNSVIVHLRPKTFQLLLALIENHERIVTKDELLTNVWRDTTVTDNALVQCVIELRKAIGDEARPPRSIRTIARVGYQLIGAVEEVSESVQAIPELPAIDPEPAGNAPQTSSRKRWIWLAAAAVCLAAVAGSVLLITKTPTVASRRTVAVMPFENQTGTAELDWLREGLPDMLITNLSRSPQLSLLSRQPASKSAGHADIVLLGTFAKLGEQIRIGVQLQNPKTGRVLAAESILAIRPEQIVSQMDLLAVKMAAKLGSPISPNAAGLSTLMTNNLEAHRSYSLGLDAAEELRPAEAIALFTKAVQLDPDFAMAQARIGYTYAVSWDKPVEGRPYLERAFRLSKRLTEKDRLDIAAWYAIANLDFANAMRTERETISKYPDDMEPYTQLGRLLAGEERYDEAIAVFQRSLTVDPDTPMTHNELRAAYSYVGKHDAAIAEAERFVALAPAEPNAVDSLGYSYQIAERYPEAEASFRRALALKPDFDLATIHLANVYFQTGRYREAEAQCERFIELAQSVGDRVRGHECLAEIYLHREEAGKAQAEADAALRQTQDCCFFEFIVAADRSDFTGLDDALARLRSRVFTERGRRGTGRTIPFVLGRLALLHGRTEEAIGYFKEALRSRPAYYWMDWWEDCLADAYFRLGRVDEAIAEYQRALTVHPGMALVRCRLAAAYDRQGNHQLATAEYRRFLDLWKNADPDIPEVVAARNRVAGRS